MHAFCVPVCCAEQVLLVTEAICAIRHRLPLCCVSVCSAALPPVLYCVVPYCLQLGFAEPAWQEAVFLMDAASTGCAVTFLSAPCLASCIGI